MIPLPEGLDQYIYDHCSPEMPLLRELTRDTREHSRMPQMQTGHVEASLLRMLVQISGARRVLEIGTYTGYSAFAMASGLPDDGELLTCDIDPIETEKARTYWARSPHGGKIRLVLGDAIETVARLEGTFDLAFIDADKKAYPAYWDAVLPKIRANGLIAVDNTLWGGRVVSPEDELERAIHAFNEKVARDERVDVVMLSVRDGLTLARKR